MNGVGLHRGRGAACRSGESGAALTHLGVDAGGEWNVGAPSAPRRYFPDWVGGAQIEVTWYQRDIANDDPARHGGYLIGPDQTPLTADDNPFPSGVCEISYLQHMEIYCSNLDEWKEYEPHYLGWSVNNDPNTLFLERDSWPVQLPW